MKKHLRIASLLLVLVLALGLFAGCGPKNETPSEQPSQSQQQPSQSQQQPSQSTEKREDLVICQQEDIDTFDPRGTSMVTSQTIHQTIYVKLFTRNEGKFVNCLAKSYDAINDTTIQIKINKGWKYSDGSEITVDDVVYCLNLAANSTRMGALVAKIVDAEKIDDETVQINLSGPAPSLQLALSHPGTSILPQWFTEKQEAAGNWDGSLASGPYMLGERAIGQYTKVVRNPYWADDQVPELPCGNKSITFRFVPEASTRTILVESGEADYNSSFATSDYARCKADSNLKIWEAPSTTMYYINMDCSMAPFDNKLVRQAVMYSIDRQAQVDAILDGLGTPLFTALGKGCIGYVENPGNYSYDPEKAKALLAEAGYPNGFDTKIMAFNDLGKRNAELVQGWLADIGINATVEVYDSGVRASMQQNHQVPMNTGSWGCFVDTDLVWPRLLAKSVVDSGNSSTYWWNERLDQIYEEARVYDESARIPLYEEGCRILAEECPWVPIYAPSALALTRAGLQGVNFDGNDGIHNLWTLHY